MYKHNLDQKQDLFCVSYSRLSNKYTNGPIYMGHPVYYSTSIINTKVTTVQQTAEQFRATMH